MASDMQTEGSNKLAEKVERAEQDSRVLASEVAEALSGAFPDVRRGDVPDAALLDATEAALHVVHRAVPGWEISLRGVALEPDGHWHCTLRETGETDDDAVIGFAEAPSPPRAVIAALLRSAAARTGG